MGRQCSILHLLIKWNDVQELCTTHLALGDITSVTCLESIGCTAWCLCTLWLNSKRKSECKQEQMNFKCSALTETSPIYGSSLLQVRSSPWFIREVWPGRSGRNRWLFTPCKAGDLRGPQASFRYNPFDGDLTKEVNTLQPLCFGSNQLTLVVRQSDYLYRDIFDIGTFYFVPDVLLRAATAQKLATCKWPREAFVSLFLLNLISKIPAVSTTCCQQAEPYSFAAAYPICFCAVWEWALRGTLPLQQNIPIFHLCLF